MKRRLAFFAALAASAFAGVTASPAASALAVAPAAAAKPCSSSYVHATLSWGHKCLREGQFCKVGNREYLRYGFSCPSSGHLRRR